MAKFYLVPAQFSEKERTVVEHASLSASIFAYESGVEAVRLRNDRGELVLLPYQGQQIWSAAFDGEELQMRSTFRQPVRTQEYMATYGGLMLHCGMTAMGVPTAPEDTYPLHGELPNAPFERAWIEAGKDAGGYYIALSGAYEHVRGFNVSYEARPVVKLYEGRAVFDIELEVENKRHSPMEYMYLCHINFRPVDGSRLVYSAKRDAEHIIPHMNVGKNAADAEASPLEQYLRRLAENLALHDAVGAEGQVYDPEVVFTMFYESDAEGNAYTLQRMPGGRSFYVRHNVQELPVGVRWIARTSDEDAMGMILPATARSIGRAVAREEGRMRTIGAGETISIRMQAGLLDEAEGDAVEAKIDAILK